MATQLFTRFGRKFRWLLLGASLTLVASPADAQSFRSNGYTGSYQAPQSTYTNGYDNFGPVPDAYQVNRNNDSFIELPAPGGNTICGPDGCSPVAPQQPSRGYENHGRDSQSQYGNRNGWENGDYGRGGNDRGGNDRGMNDRDGRDRRAPAPRGEYGPVNPGYETRKPVTDPNQLWQSGPQYVPQQQEKAEPSEAELIEARISARYGNPAVMRFIKATPIARFSQLYSEASQLIDSRHIEPNTYQARVDQAVKNLQVAIANPQFQTANGLRLNASQAAAFRQELASYQQTRPVRNLNDTLQFLAGAASIGSRAGVSTSVIAAEFMYGAAESLDKYSSFNPEAPSAMPSASTGLEDHVVGIGVEIKPTEQGVVVVKPVRGGPAEQAGVQRGDVITNVNGRSIAGQTMDFAVDLIGGQKGTPVMLGIVREGRPMSLSMRRDTVRVYSVSEVQMLDPQQKVGYIKLDKFAEASSEEMDQALWQLYNQGMQSLVLDLRGNPGGLLTTAVSLSDKFLPGGTIVSTRGRNTADNTMEKATRAKTWKTPLVVVVDENSASASEIFAAAIQENGRGIVVGRRSYGKGTVQTHFPLRTVAGNFKLTTAKFYSPNGRVMAGAGVTPDVVVPKMHDDAEVVQLLRDADVLKAVEVAGGSQVRELASQSERNMLLGQR